MEFTPVDRLAAELHFTKAHESLRALATVLQPLAPDVASGVACPFCGNRVMRAATLCGSCWRKLDPSRES